MTQFNYQDYLKKNYLLKESSMEQSILDFWGTQQDDASQSDDEYEAEWDTQFFIDEHPQFQGEESNINALVKSLDITLNESYDSIVKEKWDSLSDDVKMNLLTSVWDDSDEAEKHLEKSFDELPEAAKQNMRMDALEEGDGMNEDASSLYREKQTVMELLLTKMQEIATENPDELTHDFLLKLKNTIDDLIISDF